MSNFNLTDFSFSSPSTPPKSYSPPPEPKPSHRRVELPHAAHNFNEPYHWHIFYFVPIIRNCQVFTLIFINRMDSSVKFNLSASITAIFGDNISLSKGDLMQWLREVYPDSSEKALTWRIHDLKNRGVIVSAGRGVYQLGRASSFQPSFDSLARRIARLLAKELPLVKNCIWETRWISGWMELQPPYNWTIVETEKEVLESVFTSLSGISKKVFLDPDRKVVDLYILTLNESVIVKPLLSESPTFPIEKITSATPEKILVDIVAEPYLFRAQQGELDRIYANAFKEVRINQTKMLRYANRRRKYDAVYSLIPLEYRLPKTSR
ncbi:MAG: hypothetical protein IPH04_14230 [Saprospirales bacterium]|nr:hypothetical protein [Saprospirales bacterium]